MIIDGHNIRHAVEVGAGDAESSQLLPNVPVIDRVTLIEPNTILARSLIAATQSHRHVLVYPAAAGVQEGWAPLVHMGYGSFIKGAPAFLPLGCEADCETYWAPLTSVVPVMTLAEVEKERGPIDWLVLTCNGSECAALATLTSCPKLIHTKAYLHNPRHFAAYNDLMGWLVYCGYRASELLETNQHQTYAHTRWVRSRP